MANFYKTITRDIGRKHVCYKTILDKEELVIRLADQDDYDHMMAVSSQVNFYYDGTDYIPSLYHYLLDTGKVIMFLMFIGIKPVAFSTYYMSSNDRELLEFGSRIIPDHKGRKLYQILGSQSLHFLVTQIPTIKRLVTIGVMSKLRLNFQQHHKATSLFVYHHLVFGSSLNTLQNLKENKNNSKDHNNVIQISKDKVTSILNDPYIQRVFNNSGIFCADPMWIPYHVNVKNLTEVAQRHLVFISEKQDGVINSLTFACSLAIPAGIMLDVYYYGELDSKLCIQHSLKALSTFRQSYCSYDDNMQIRFAINFPEGIRSEEIENYFCSNNLGTVISSKYDNKVNVAAISVDRLIAYKDHKL